jgi:hypothetical protein
LTREELGITHDRAGSGAERLLIALLKRGLHATDVRAAAKLCEALDEGRP